MFCQNCGKELPEGAAFCPECGAKVTETVTETVTPETVETVSTAETVASAAAASTAVFDEENKAVKREETFKEKYFCFQGRLNRKPYILRSILLSIGSGIVAGILAVLLGDSLLSIMSCAAISVAAFLSALSLCVRRLHDLNRTGLLWLLSFIPVINFFLAIYVIFFKGTEGDNRYGPDPLAR